MYVAAQYDLGLMYVNGEGVSEDWPLAYMWVSIAAAGGDEKGQQAVEVLTKNMTPEQLREGQRLFSEWIENHQ